MIDKLKSIKQNIKHTISKTSFHDLTHLIYPDMLTYPGEPQPEFQPFLN